MSNMNTEAKRYQNPEVFEQLAIEYVVGALQGRARKRFETLMDTHFYLQAIVEAYEHKFAHLVELLPEVKPSTKVWKTIESHIKSSTEKASTEENSSTKSSWWQSAFFKQGFGVAAMVAIVSAVLILNPMTVTPSASAYTAIMESESKVPMAVTKITKSDMSLSIDIMKPVVIADDMELTLWCQPKGSGMPMKMGTVSKSGVTKITISKKEWQSMKNVGVLAISIEKKGDLMVRQPTGRILLRGELSTAHLN